MKRNMRKTKTLKKSGKDCINVVTSLLIEGIALIDFKGLKILNVLKARKLTSMGKNSKTPVITTAKSITFQESLKYAF